MKPKEHYTDLAGKIALELWGMHDDLVKFQQKIRKVLDAQPAARICCSSCDQVFAPYSERKKCSFCGAKLKGKLIRVG